MSGYRMLEAGETIKDGDQWQDSVRGWLPVSITVGASVKQWEAGIYRRAKTIEDQAHEYADALLEIGKALGLPLCAEPAEIVERVKALVTPNAALAKEIAVALLTPHGGPECHRLQIMQKMQDGTERNMGGNNKQSIINVICQVFSNAGSVAPPKQDSNEAPR